MSQSGTATFTRLYELRTQIDMGLRRTASVRHQSVVRAIFENALVSSIDNVPPFKENSLYNVQIDIVPV